MSEIFISYAREDRDTAQLYAEAFEKEGYSVWWDPVIPAGRVFDEVVEEALDHSGCVVVLWSSHSTASRWVKTEAGEGANRGILIPIQVEAVKVPLAFRRIQAADMVGWEGDTASQQFKKLLRDVSRIVAPPNKPGAGKSLQADEETGRRSEDNGTHELAKAKPGIVEQKQFTENKARQSATTKRRIKLKPGKIFRDSLKDRSKGPQMVLVRSGRFRMGDLSDFHLAAAERPVHEVSISQALALGRYEVTYEEYDRYADACGRQKPKDEGRGRGRLPVVYVSWEEATAYAQWLSEETGCPYRLPSEAEWEYAARGGTETEFWWGDTVVNNNANCMGGIGLFSKFGCAAAPVGSFRENPFGLFDTLGNVSEWVQDCYHKNFHGAPTDGSAWLTGECNSRVVRGGSWKNHITRATSSYRGRRKANQHFFDIGFRIAREIE